MPIFADDFNRADGGLGANWTVIDGSMSISNNAATSASSGTAIANGAALTGDQQITLEVRHDGSSGGTIIAILKYSSSPARDALVTCTLANGGVTVGLSWWNGSQQIQLDSGYVTLPAPPTVTIICSYVGSTLSCTIGGTLVASATLADVASYGGYGLACYANNPFVDSFNVDQPVAQSMEVTPDPVWVGGGLVEVTATGTNTDWDPENPADTEFTVDHGVITAQAITSATTVSLFYTPADYLGAITFTESKYSLSDTINGTVIPPEGQGNGACPFNAGFITLANTTGGNHSDSQLLTEETLVHATEAPELNVDIIQAIAEIWAGMYHFGGIPAGNTMRDYFTQLLQLIAGDDTPTVSLYTAARTTSIREELEGVTDRLAALIAPADYTLENVIASVKGLDNRSITQVYDLVDALTLGSNQDVLTWLTTYLGETGPTLEGLGTMISDLATAAGYDLSDVLDAIAAIPGVDLTPITNKLNDIQPNASHTLTTITNTLSDIHGDLDVVRVDVDDIRGENNYTLTSVMDRLDDIAAAVSAIPDSALPLWPGLANVTLGAALPLTDGMTVPGPLHGLIFTITASAPRAQKFMFGTVASWARVGQVLFVTDRGDYERGQTYGIDQHIVTPTTMQSAASALILVNPNWQGTVRPWTRT